MAIELHAAGDAELWAAIDRFEQQEPGLGDRFEAAVYRALDSIAKAPYAWTPCAGLPGVRMFALWRFPFSIPYVVETGRIIVLAVAHAKREPGYWRERVIADGGAG
jgi:toxin ParE1/3/4